MWSAGEVVVVDAGVEMTVVGSEEKIREEEDWGGEGMRESCRRPRWTKAMLPVRMSMQWSVVLARKRTCRSGRNESQSIV